MAMIRETLVIALIGSGLGLLGWALAAPERLLLMLPLIAGEWIIGVWFCLNWAGDSK